MSVSKPALMTRRFDMHALQLLLMKSQLKGILPQQQTCLVVQVTKNPIVMLLSQLLPQLLKTTLYSNSSFKRQNLTIIQLSKFRATSRRCQRRKRIRAPHKLMSGHPAVLKPRLRIISLPSSHRIPASTTTYELRLGRNSIFWYATWAGSAEVLPTEMHVRISAEPWLWTSIRGLEQTSSVSKPGRTSVIF
jgi:hypothetical protein